MLVFTFNGAKLIADPTGALVWPDRETLVVSDLHFEKASAFAARGVPLPPYDTAATLDQLDGALRRHRPRRVICLGDSFHDQDAAERAGAETKARIRALTSRLDWLWIAGNHDPAPDPSWGGTVARDHVEGPLVFRHEAAPGGMGEVSGHFHPKARVKLRGKSVSGRCFVTDGARLMMPAFGAFTGGLDVTSPEVSALFKPGLEVFFLGPSKVHRFPRAQLITTRYAAA